MRERKRGAEGEVEGMLGGKEALWSWKDKATDGETLPAFLRFAGRKRRFSSRETYVSAGRNVWFPDAGCRK